MSQVHAHAISNSRLVNRSPVFYGWIIMLVGTLGLIMTSPGQTYAVSIFIEYFINDLGISRGWVSTLYTAGTLIGSFALPLVGRQIDRRGARLMMSIVAILFGLACIYMGFVVNALMLGLGFVAIRMLGQGSLSLISQNVINQCFIYGGDVLNYSIDAPDEILTAIVPDIVGISEYEAKATLLSSGFTVGNITVSPETGHPSNVVLSSDPISGSELNVGSPVNLVVSEQ